MTTRHCTPDCVPGDCRHDWNPPPLGSQVGAAKARIGVHFTATRWHLEDGTPVIDEVHIHDTVVLEALHAELRAAMSTVVIRNGAKLCEKCRHRGCMRIVGHEHDGPPNIVQEYVSDEPCSCCGPDITVDDGFEI